MTISVIVPSRLARKPSSHCGNLYLNNALASITRQAIAPIEVIVALDPGILAKVPPPYLEHGPLPLRFLEAATAGQAAAVNAAVKVATGEWLAFLEDDDTWEPARLATGVELARRFNYEFVTCNQRETTEGGMFVRHNDFPTPSGWLLRASVFRDLGGLDETFRLHVDTDFLGKANAAGVKRCHVVEVGALGMQAADDDTPGATETRRRLNWISMVSMHSAVIESTQREPLVQRTVNPDGGMAAIERGGEAAEQSRKEHAIMAQRYGGQYPW